MFCFERGNQRVFGIHRENLRPGSEPEAYDICGHELSPAERVTSILAGKSVCFHHNPSAEADDTRREMSIIHQRYNCGRQSSAPLSARLHLILAVDAKGRLS